MIATEVTLSLDTNRPPDSQERAADISAAVEEAASRSRRRVHAEIAADAVVVDSEAAERADSELRADAALRAAEAFDPGEEPSAEPAPGRQAGRIARSTAFFSVATAASRIAGLVREVVAAGYYGVSGPMSAFTIAFQVPNLVRSLFADAALQPAFVPVFTEHLEKKQYREAFRLASTLILLVTMVLGVITALFIIAAPVIMPLFAPGFTGEIKDLTITLSRILFPILIMLGTSGIVVGILNSYDRFGAFAIAPLFWNVTIIVVLIVLIPSFHGDNRIYAYAIGIVIGTAVQLAIPVWDLRNTPFKFRFSFDWRNPGVRRVLLLMLPVTLSLGLINFNLLINSLFGSLVSDEGPAAIDKAFRIYQLPQGIFSVAIATVLFPTLARFAARGDHDSLRSTMANGMRQISFVLLPAAAAVLVLSEPMIRLVYQRGEFTPAQTQLVATALFWFAFSLPTNGLFLLLTRTFFSLQRPWIPTSISAANLAVTAVAAYLLYKPFGLGGIVASTAIATTISVIAQAFVLRRELHGLELGRFFFSVIRITIASAALGAVSYEVWDQLDQTLGRSFGGQVVSLGTALALGGLVYLGLSKLLRVPELDQIIRLLRRSR